VNFTFKFRQSYEGTPISPARLLLDPKTKLKPPNCAVILLRLVYTQGDVRQSSCSYEKHDGEDDLAVASTMVLSALNGKTERKCENEHSRGLTAQHRIILQNRTALIHPSFSNE